MWLKVLAAEKLLHYFSPPQMSGCIFQILNTSPTNTTKPRISAAELTQHANQVTLRPTCNDLIEAYEREYTIEKILDRTGRGRDLQYLIKWFEQPQSEGNNFK